MEHDDKALPIDIKVLGGYASRCHAYAKALRYKEQEFMNGSLPDTIEHLISINNNLQQPGLELTDLRCCYWYFDVCTGTSRY